MYWHSTTSNASVASREIIQSYNQYFVELDITYLQGLVFMVFWEENEMTVNGLHLDDGILILCVDE